MFAFHLAKDGQRLVTRTLLTESLVDDRGKVEVLGQKLLDSREYVRIDGHGNLGRCDDLNPTTVGLRSSMSQRPSPTGIVSILRTGPLAAAGWHEGSGFGFTPRSN